LTPARAIARIVARAIEWQRETAKERQPKTPAEIALDKAVETYKTLLRASTALPKRSATFESEAPTTKRRRKP
jgi:hypothetical protein